MLTTAALVAITSLTGSGGTPVSDAEALGLTDSLESLPARTSTAEALPRLLGFDPTVAAPQSGIDLIHPRTFFSYTISTGNQEIMFNTTDTTNVPPNPKGDETALFHGIRAEHFFANQVGVFFSGDFGTVEDLSITFNAATEEMDIDTLLFFLGVSYRATIDDDFRIPVRLGPYFHQATIDVFGNEFEYTTLGLKLIAEPEFIIFQHLQGERMSELTAFLEVGIGTGPSTVEDNFDEEEGNSFSASLELGLRYKFFNGILVGLSFIDRKQYYGATDSYDSNPAVVFNGTEDDYLAGGLTIGGRF